MKAEINLSWGRVLFALIGSALFWVAMHFCTGMAPYVLWSLTLTLFVNALIIDQIYNQAVKYLKRKLGEMKRSTYRWKLTLLWLRTFVAVMVIWTVFYFVCYYISTLL